MISFSGVSMALLKADDRMQTAYGQTKASISQGDCLGWEHWRGHGLSRKVGGGSGFNRGRATPLPT